MYRILLLSPTGKDTLSLIGDACKKALVRAGCSVEVFDYRMSRIAAKIPFKIKRFIPFSHRDILPLRKTEDRLLTRDLFKKISDFCPDVLLVLKGENIGCSILKQIRDRGIITANWFMDTVISPYYRPFVEEISPYYDFFFIVDPLDVMKKVDIASRVVSLPLGFDRDIFRPIELNEEERLRYASPITFVGTVVDSRVPVLEKISDLGLSIWGPDRSIDGRWARKSKTLARCYRGRPVYGEEVVKVYNASDIVFSVHGNFPDIRYNVTPRIFEVAACRAFHIVDYVPQVKEFYRIDEEIVCYTAIDQIPHLCRYYLSHTDERNAIAERAYFRAMAEHTYDHRIARLISTIKNGCR